MKEHPILFSGPMVHAILEGRKSQTRRVVSQRWLDRSDRDDESKPCPYGAPGDRLWVRETWAPVRDPEAEGLWFDYRATPRFADPGVSHPAGWENAPEDEDAIRWRPSIHMPREASRLTLEVTGVRVEPLQSITEEDAIAEGARRWDLIPDPARERTPWGVGPRWSMFEPRNTDECLRSARFAFGNAWDKINGARAPWASNPWVWVVEFRRLGVEERAA